MPSILRVLDDSAQTHEVVLLERHGQQLRLQSPLHIAPGTAVQLRLEGDLLLGESAASIAASDHFEITMHASQVMPASWRPHPEWRALDSGRAVMGSLIALNAQLMLYEERRGSFDGAVGTAGTRTECTAIGGIDDPIHFTSKS